MAKKEEKNLRDVIKLIKQKFGEGAIMVLKEEKVEKVPIISTGCLSLDMALGVGGIPRGRVIEIYGGESSGKTTLALHIIAEAQKQGGVGAFIDVEHALDPEYAKRIGVKIEDLLISQPDSGEEALQIVETLVKSGEVDVIVIDSVAALAPKMEIEAEMGETQIGLQARLMSMALRKLTASISKTKTALVFLNQTRMKIGQYGKPETTPGGLALKFYASVRIELQRKAQIKRGDEIVGSKILAKVTKNKVAPPFKSAEFDIYWGEGISKYADLMNCGLKFGIIKKTGNWYEYENKKLGQGIEGVKKFLVENPKIFDEIKEKILSSAKST